MVAKAQIGREARGEIQSVAYSKGGIVFGAFVEISC